VLQGKGGKDRTIGFDSTAFAMIEQWLDRRAALRINGRRRVFCTLDGKPLKTAYVRALLPRLAANRDSGALVTAASPVRLSLDMTSVGSSDALDWYWAIVIDDTVHWLTSSGVAASPAPLLSGPAVDLVDLELMNQPFPSGTVLYSLFVLVADDTVVALDSIAIFVP